LSAPALILRDDVLRFVEHLHQLFAARIADHAIDLSAVDEHHEAGDAIDVELARELPVSRRIDLADGIARVFQRVDHRLHLHARAATWRPEIEQEDFAAAGCRPEKRTRQRQRRCESDHPFPPWIGGRLPTRQFIVARASHLSPG
jgi:hypothetical protein